MSNNERPQINPEWNKGFQFWEDEIIKTGVQDKLRRYNDLLTGKEAPTGYGEPVIQDVMLDGKNCDIYHTDKERTDTYHRIFIHIKE